jgi:hypothetical protein
MTATSEQADGVERALRLMATGPLTVLGNRMARALDELRIVRQSIAEDDEALMADIADDLDLGR